MATSCTWLSRKPAGVMRFTTPGSPGLAPVSTGAGPVEVTIDGQPHQGSLLPVFGDGREHRVTVRVPRA